MDFVFWIIVLVVIAGVAWWWRKRKSSSPDSGGQQQQEGTRSDGGARTDGAPAGGGAAASTEAAVTTGTATGFAPAEPAAPATAPDPVPANTAADIPAAPREHSGTGTTAVSTGAGTGTAAAAGAEANEQDERRVQDEAEWETQWSEASGSTRMHEEAGHREGVGPASPAQAQPNGAPSAVEDVDTDPSRPVHHPEYTGPHAPTLPGAETAALEDANDAGTTVSAPAPLGSASSGAQEPAGHLAADEPYGVGSASAAADGTGPADYTVKGDASGMVYYEEGHPEYGQIRADVWFESAAHAEAAGFRVPRRRRI